MVLDKKELFCIYFKISFVVESFDQSNKLSSSHVCVISELWFKNLRLYNLIVANFLRFLTFLFFAIKPKLLQGIFAIFS